MKSEYCARMLLIAALATVLWQSPVRAAEPEAPAPRVSAGAIVGLVTNSAKLPMAGATVTAVRSLGGIRATISNSEGVYTFADLAPGSWSLAIEVEGYPEVTVPALQVLPGKATRRDIAMNVPATAPAAPAFAAAPTPAPTPAPAPAPAAPPAAPAAPSAAQIAAILPEALQSPAPAPEPDLQTPFAVGDWAG